MWYLQSKEMIFLIAVSFISLIPFYAVSLKYNLKISSNRHVVQFFLIWCAFFVFEYYVFGPFSFIGREVDGIDVALQNYLAQRGDVVRFAQEYGGGQDLGVMEPSQQYVQLDRLLLHVLPIWIVVLLHKVILAVLGFAGCYLLAMRMPGCNRSIAVLIASLYPLSNIYLLIYSFEFGTGFAVIPLAVYACVTCTRQNNYYLWVGGVSLIVALAQPMKIFPPLLVATACCVIMFKRVDIKRTVIGILVFSLVSLLNWHESLYSLYTILEFTTRSSDIEIGSSGFIHEVSKIPSLFANMWVFSLLLFFSLAVLAVKKDKFIFRAVGATALFPFIFIFAEVFPWNSVGLAFVGSMEHAYMRLSISVFTVPIAAQAFSHLTSGASEQHALWRFISPKAALMAMSLSLLTWNKLLDTSLLLAFGGQANLFGYNELKYPEWRGPGDFRVITLFDTPRPNVVAGYYKLDSFDGAPLFYIKRWDEYWSAILRLLPPKKKTGARTRVIPHWGNLNGQAYELDKDVRSDLLRVANVKYIISALPLEGKSYKLLVDSKKEDWPKIRPKFFNGFADYLLFRARRIFDPGKNFVYTLDRPLPRVFAARGVEVVEDGVEPGEFYGRIEAVAPNRIIVVKRRYAKGLSVASGMRVLSHKKLVDGYDISVSAENGGILVLNNTYLPFWEARANGKPLSIVPVNGIHMAMVVPPGTTEVRVRYNRPLLREKMSKHIEGVVAR